MSNSEHLYINLMPCPCTFLIHFAGTDNHIGEKQKRFGGIKTESPIKDELDFVMRVKNGEALPFIKEIEQDN